MNLFAFYFSGAGYLKSYFFMISSQSDLGKWSNRAKLLNQLRTVADRVFCFHVCNNLLYNITFPTLFFIMVY